MVKIPWVNSEIRMFAVRNDKPRYLEYSSIWRIMFTRKRFIVKSLMPFGFTELFLIDGCRVDLVREIAVPVNQYNLDSVVMRFGDCTLENQWLMYPMAANSSEQQFMNINAEFSYSNYELILGDR